MKRLILISLCCVRLIFAQSGTALKRPIALDKLPSGDLFVLTQMDGVYRLHESNGSLSKIGSFNLPPWQAPSDIVTAVANKEPTLFIAVLMRGNGFVSQYTLDGKLRSTWSTGRVPSGLDFDPKTDTIYVASAEGAEIYELSVNAREPTFHYCGAVLGARQLGPVVVDDSRNQLIVGDVLQGELYSFDLKTHKSHLLTTKLGSPQALLLSADGRQLLIADGVRRTIYRLDLSKPNSRPTIFSAETVYRDPVGLALVSSGNIVVADDQANALFVVSSSGSRANH